MNRDEVEKVKHRYETGEWVRKDGEVVIVCDSWLTLEQRNRELEEEKKTREMEIEKLKRQVKMFREKLWYDDHDPTGPTSDAECTSC